MLFAFFFVMPFSFFAPGPRATTELQRAAKGLFSDIEMRRQQQQPETLTIFQLADECKAGNIVLEPRESRMVDKDGKKKITYFWNRKGQMGDIHVFLGMLDDDDADSAPLLLTEFKGFGATSADHVERQGAALAIRSPAQVAAWKSVIEHFTKLMFESRVMPKLTTLEMLQMFTQTFGVKMPFEDGIEQADGKPPRRFVLSPKICVDESVPVERRTAFAYLLKQDGEWVFDKTTPFERNDVLAPSRTMYGVASISPMQIVQGKLYTSLYVKTVYGEPLDAATCDSSSLRVGGRVITAMKRGSGGTEPVEARDGFGFSEFSAAQADAGAAAPADIHSCVEPGFGSVLPPLTHSSPVPGDDLVAKPLLGQQGKPIA